MFWLFSCCLGPLSRHGNSAPWAYIVVSLQQCSFFLTLRGNFGADSNNFGPCPSHAFRLSELQSLTDLLLYPVVVWANRGGFDSYNGNNSPSLRPDSMAPNPAPETTSCFAASVALLVLAPLQSQWRESESGPGPASARVRVTESGLGPGLPVPESESLNQADGPPCQCAPAKLELELEPSTENT